MGGRKGEESEPEAVMGRGRVGPGERSGRRLGGGDCVREGEVTGGVVVDGGRTGLTDGDAGRDEVEREREGDAGGAVTMEREVAPGRRYGTVRGVTRRRE